MPKNKKVSTIEGLARLMQSEFLGVHHRFDTVHRRLDSVEAHVHEMRKDSSELFAKLDEFISLYRDTRQELNVLTRQVKRLEGRIMQIEGRR